jgi:hypothetical protein
VHSRRLKAAAIRHAVLATYRAEGLKARKSLSCLIDIIEERLDGLHNHGLGPAMPHSGPIDIL